MGKGKKILIIEDNVTNIINISRTCRSVAPEWDVVYLLVYHLPSEVPKSQLPDGVSGHDGIRSLDDAARVLSAETVDSDMDLIIFYDLALGQLQKGVDTGLNSPITSKLAELSQQIERKVLINVCSTDLNTGWIGAKIDPSGQRVITQHYFTGRAGDEITELVRETINKWHTNFMALRFDEFIKEMERMEHEQIDAFERWVTRKARKVGDYRDPKDILRRFLVMESKEFEQHFCNADGSFLPGVAEALKGIGGVRNENGKNQLRPLSWGGGWFLALRQFRELSNGKEWMNCFDVGELIANRGWSLHPKQTEERRRKTIAAFYDMCGVLFRKRDTEKECILEKVTLNQNKFSFSLNFPCTSDGHDQQGSLWGRVFDEVSNSIYLTEREFDPKRIEHLEHHDSSLAIWRFYLYSNVSDFKEFVEDRFKGGIFGFHTRMNVVSYGRKTEVVWKNHSG